MPLVAMVCATLIGLADGTPPTGPDVAADYQRASATAGRGSADQVRLALWCEAHGLSAERARHLTLAVLADPTNAMARGLAGLVARDGRWTRPDAVAEAVRADPAAAATLAEYDDRRSKTPYTADAQWALALWADEHGLKDQARAHCTAVARLDPARDAAWKRLGYKKHDGRWATDAQLTAAKAESDAQKAADKLWKPRLEKWKGMLARPSQRDEAKAALLGVTDPRAVPSVLRTFGTDKADDQQVAVALLGQVESPQASRVLAALAVTSRSADVRRSAVETLRHRDPRDFVGSWIGLIRPTIKYEVRPVVDASSPGTLLIKGAKANTRRVYSPLSPPDPASFGGVTLSYDADGLPVLNQNLGTRTDFSARIRGSEGRAMILGPQLITDPAELGRIASLVPDRKLGQALDAFAKSASAGPQPWPDFFVSNDAGGRVPFNPNANYEGVFNYQRQIPIGRMMLEAQASAQVAQGQMSRDVAAIDRSNKATTDANEPVLGALRDVTDQAYGDDTEAWNRWWTDQRGYAFAESSTDGIPTIVEAVPIGFSPLAMPSETRRLVGLNQSCFAAGTPVRTVDGTKPIELIRRGDLVLVQDTAGGGLSYQPVLTAFHNPPSTTYRVKLGDDEVHATGIHRFWKAGHGWTMARDLKPGDSLRVLGGVASVESVTPEKTEPVFNLEVAEGRSFFVGRLGVLVHDNSLVEATPDPFDAAGAVIAAKGDAPR